MGFRWSLKVKITVIGLFREGRIAKEGGQGEVNSTPDANNIENETRGINENPRRFDENNTNETLVRKNEISSKLGGIAKRPRNVNCLLDVAQTEGRPKKNDKRTARTYRSVYA